MSDGDLSLPTAVARAGPATVVIFGAAGDLTRRLLMPSLYNLAAEGWLPEQFSVIGFARTETAEDALREQFRATIQAAAGARLDAPALEWLLARFAYIRSAFDRPEGWQALEERLGGRGGAGVLFYLATAPDQFVPICRELAQRRLLDEGETGWRRVIVEKPFGSDLPSARALNAELRELMSERQIYRIDHYLGKETVQNILVFRFGNGIFEPVWNRRYIDHVQISVAETVGVEGRGSYYDQTGALRDMVPNHLFQLLTLTAMEPPSTLASTSLHNEQLKVLESVEPLTREDCGRASVRAQYREGTLQGKHVPAYTHEPRVPADSQTETFAAFRLRVDNWRWAGVPFYLRTGKRLAKKKTEVVIQFRHAPLALFRQASVELPAANRLVIAIQPDEGISLELAAKVPGPAITVGPVGMRFDYEEYFGASRYTGYETLLYDAMTGDRSLYKRSDIIERGWAIVQPIIEAWGERACGLEHYPAGSAGPGAAADLLARDGRAWRPL